MLTLEFTIVRLEHQARNAKFNNLKEIEGFAVARPGLLERALAALRGERNRNQAPADRPVGKLAHGAIAR